MLQQATLNLSFTEVRAPVDGRVGRQMITVGNLVQGSTPATATVLTDLVSVDEVYVYFEAPERAALVPLGFAGFQPCGQRAVSAVTAAAGSDQSPVAAGL